MSYPETCGDCAVPIGQPHLDGCDVARCLYTGDQRLACHGRHDCGQDVWTGRWPGDAECQEFGWYARWSETTGWQQCSKDTPGAHEDLNRLHSGGAVWDRAAGRWRLRGK